MKWILLAFGLALSIVLVYIDAEFGRKMGVGEDAWIWAFGFGAITCAGLGGLTVAVRLGRYRKYAWCIGAVLLSLGCVAISLSNGMGAVAGRMNKAQAERVKTNKSILADGNYLKDMQDEKKGLHFKDTDEAAVNVAKAKADTATKAREIECRGVQDNRCIKKQEMEQTALTEYRDTLQNKKMTDRAAKLEKDIPDLKNKIENAGLILKANSQGAALASLLGYPENQADWVMARQNFLMATFWAILAAFCLGAFETMYAHEKDAHRRLRAEDVPEATAVRVAPPDNIARLPKRTPPLIAARPDVLENVTIIMADILEPDSGKVQREAVYAAYVQGCEERGWIPASEPEFSAAMAKLCRNLRIQIENRNDGVFYKGVAIAAPS